MRFNPLGESVAYKLTLYTGIGNLSAAEFRISFLSISSIVAHDRYNHSQFLQGGFYGSEYIYVYNIHIYIYIYIYHNKCILLNMSAKFILKKQSYFFFTSRCLTPAYRRLLCNALILRHFDYGCSSWTPLLKKNLKRKLQKAQNKCIRFCLNLPRSHINPSHFRKIKWLPVSDRVEYCIANTVFKYWNGIVPGYIHEMFKPSLCRYSTRSKMALDIPLRKAITRQKSLSFLGPKLRSKIEPSIKNVRTSSSLMHAIKKNILLYLQR